MTDNKPDLVEFNGHLTHRANLSAFENHAPKQSTDKLTELRESAEELVQLENALAALAQDMSDLNKRKNELAQDTIPKQMEELGMKTFELEDGSKIKIKEFMSGSLPKEQDRFYAAVDWLECNDFGDIIKTDVTMKFGKGEDNLAKNAIAMLQEAGYEPDEKYGVHPKTLYAAMREYKQVHGEDPPYELLGLYAGKKADVRLGGK